MFLRRSLLLATALLVLATPAGASSSDPAPRTSTLAVAEVVAAASGEFIHLTTALSFAPDIAANLASCETVAEALARCTRTALGPCWGALSAAWEEATRIQHQGERSHQRASALRVATEIAEALHALGTAAAASQNAKCGTLLGPGRIPAQLRLLGDGRTLRLRPLVPLRMDRDYALEVEGATTAERDAARARTLPRPSAEGVELPRGGFVLPLIQAIPNGAGGIDVVAATNLLRRLEAKANAAPGFATVPGLQVTWPAALAAADLMRLQFSFTTKSTADEEKTLLAFHTRDDRTMLAELRRRLHERSCTEIPLDPVERLALLGSKGGDATIYRGSLTSLNAIDTTIRTQVPFLLALPGNVDQSTPLVLVLHGHGGSALRSLRRHLDELTERDLAVLAIDLPDHGMHGGTGKRFLDPLDPAGLGDHLRQSAVDALATIDTSLRCGFVLPSGWDWHPPDVRYLGYSVGAMVGILLRSVEPDLGATALLAAAGDLPRWVMVHTLPALGANYVACVGGPEEGKDCVAERGCAAPGICTLDPYLFQLAEQFFLPFAWAAAAGEPLAYARERIGQSSHAPLLLATGGTDSTLSPLLATRLSDALGLAPVGGSLRRGPHALRIQWPQLGHELRENPAVRRQAADFIASAGRIRPQTPSENNP
ncbi:MAG: hypothetical protein VCC00_03000 [Deltaproteobacteria bacterium]